MMKNSSSIIDNYPRPQLRRNSFLSLDGLWDFAISKEGKLPESYKDKINVPYVPQSPMSGICCAVKDKSYLFYRRTFILPDGFINKKVLLHIGAADQICDVYLNSHHILHHEGGYTPFSADITDWLEDENLLVIRVYDDLADKSFPYGKQRQKRGGMWYTPVSGIWQSVWIESVPERYVSCIDITTSDGNVTIRAEGCVSGDTVRILTPDGEKIKEFDGDSVTVYIEKPRFWSPEDPYLYAFEISAGEDKIESYFAFRTLSIKTVNGIKRLCLNWEPYFFHGVLDQGYWPEGVYTPPCSCSFADDIMAMKSLGFNTLRKHIKVESERFYYECDRLGIIVFQDMVNNGSYSFIRDTALPTLGFRKRSDKRSNNKPMVRRRFLETMSATVHQLKNHPCICMWTIFNEGWGQFDSDECTNELRKLDCTRFIDSTSGWFKGKRSDVESIHTYFKPFKMPRSEKPVILSEFGGYALSIEGHLFNPQKEYGYRSFKNRDEFEAALIKLYSEQIIPTVSKGLNACILTQLSDVEDETNGLLTYDRQILKVSCEPFINVSDALKAQIKK